MVFITIVAHNEHLDLWDKNSAIIRRKLKERNLNLSVWLDCEKRLFFVETAGVSFWFTGNSNIVEQKDATVEKRIHKGNRKKKKKFHFPQKKIIVDVVMMRAVWHLSGNDTNFVLVEFLSSEGNNGTVLQRYFLQSYVVKPTVSEFQFVGKKTQHLFGKKMNGSVLKTEYFRDIVNIHSKGYVLWGSKQNSERKLTWFHHTARPSFFPSHSIFR